MPLNADAVSSTPPERSDTPAADGGRGRPWTPDEVTIMREMADQGLRIPQVAEALGRSLASVGNKSRATPGVRFPVLNGAELRKLAASKAATPTPSTPAVRAHFLTEHMSAEKRVELAGRAVENPIPMTELRSSSCRFICGDPQGFATLFCGAERQPGSAYCPEHFCLTNKPRLWQARFHDRHDDRQ